MIQMSSLRKSQVSFSKLCMQILAAKNCGVLYMGQIQKEAEVPKLTMKDFLGMVLVESVLQSEAMVHQENPHWLSGDNMRRVTNALSKTSGDIG